MMMEPVKFSKATALPVGYERAKEALERCIEIDECKDWADKAAALASYAKQADDEALFKNAMRIKGRAIRRMGELLKQVEPSKGGRPSETRGGGSPSLNTRKGAADAAGLSSDQRKQALRVASIPASDFEQAIESDKPPTVSALSKRGTKPAPHVIDHLNGRDPAEFSASIRARGEMRDMAEMCRKITPAVAVRAANAYDLDDMRKWAKTIADWITNIEKELSP